MNNYTTEEMAKEWINLHVNEERSHTYIAKKYNVNRMTVGRVLKRFNINSTNFQNKIRYNIDKFSSIKTEEDAYWLGFIYADGCVSDDNRFEISLQYQDYWHLVKLRKCLMADLDIGYNKSNDSFRISLNNDIIVKNLKLLRVTPRKSLTLKFPENLISNNLIKHFIRGYFDGDGCISVYNKQCKTIITKRVTVSLLGTKDFLDIVRKYSPITFGKYVKNNGSENTLVLSTAHRKAITFIKWLYEDSTIYLDRKYNKFELALSLRN